MTKIVIFLMKKYILSLVIFSDVILYCLNSTYIVFLYSIHRILYVVYLQNTKYSFLFKKAVGGMK